MKVLFCSHNPLDVRLGAAKVIIEAAQAMEKAGANCTLVPDEDISPGIRTYGGVKKILRFSESLRDFLRKNAANYQVVDYDHVYLPFPRAMFPKKPLLVARSVLLAQHFENIAIPRLHGLMAYAGLVLKGPGRYLERRLTIRQADETCKQADLINVSNDQDRAELIRRGFYGTKIIVVPFGLTKERFKEFERVSAGAPETPRVAFVGTFDPRKGAKEFPKIVSHVVSAIPAVKFRLLGARYIDDATVREHFPAEIHGHLEITTNFRPEDLPSLLSECSVGVFPSYVEGFGFGVLEMLAAGLPVVAYDSPGPTMMLPREFLVKPGDAGAMSARVVQLLTDTGRLSAARHSARQRARDFSWEHLGAITVKRYHEARNDRV